MGAVGPPTIPVFLDLWAILIKTVRKLLYPPPKKKKIPLPPSPEKVQLRASYEVKKDKAEGQNKTYKPIEDYFRGKDFSRERGQI